jgi:hypothetical protein
MNRIEVFDEDRAVVIELKGSVETISEVVDMLLVPALQGMTFSEETIAKGFRAYADYVLGTIEEDLVEEDPAAKYNYVLGTIEEDPIEEDPTAKYNHFVTVPTKGVFDY